MALDPNKPTVVLACSESHNWFTALAQRWHVQVVTITLEDDLLSQYGEKLAKHAITKTSDMLFFAGPCTGGSSWARLNIARGPTTSKLTQNKQFEFWKLFQVFSQLKRHAESKKAAILFELPKSCEYWNDERLKKQIKHGESHEFDGCRYGLKQTYAKKSLPFLGTLTCKNPFLRSAMATTVMDLAMVGKPRIPNVRDVLPPHHHLPFVPTAASFLLSVEGNTVSVGCSSLPDYLLKGGGRVPHLDQGTLV